MLIALSTPAVGQRLRHAVDSAQVVVVATEVGARPLGTDHVVHTLQVAKTLKGNPGATISVLELEKVSLHHRPTTGQQRLYCLHDVTSKSIRAGLAQSGAPYFSMSGHAGSNPVVANPAEDANCELARITIDSAAGVSPRKLVDRLLELALHGRGPANLRTEAIDFIAERPALLGALNPLQISDLVSRAIGETADIPFKISLASLCAEKGVDGLVDSLCISLDEVDDPRFARALGRIAAHMYGEKALDVLQPHIVGARRPQTRATLLLALGATSTERALGALISMHANKKNRPAVDAALRAHGDARALAVIGQDK